MDGIALNESTLQSKVIILSWSTLIRPLLDTGFHLEHLTQSDRSVRGRPEINKKMGKPGMLKRNFSIAICVLRRLSEKSRLTSQAPKNLFKY